MVMFSAVGRAGAAVKVANLRADFLRRVRAAMGHLAWLRYDPSDPGAFWGPALGVLTVVAEIAVLALKATGAIALPWLYAVVAVPCAWVLFWIGCIVVFIIGLLLGRVDMR